MTEETPRIFVAGEYRDNPRYRKPINTGFATCDGCGETYDYAPDAPSHVCGGARRRVAELEAALLSYADNIEQVYGSLPVEQYPGPPTSLVANMRSTARGLRK